MGTTHKELANGLTVVWQRTLDYHARLVCKSRHDILVLYANNNVFNASLLCRTSFLVGRLGCGVLLSAGVGAPWRGGAARPWALSYAGRSMQLPVCEVPGGSVPPPPLPLSASPHPLHAPAPARPPPPAELRRTRQAGAERCTHGADGHRRAGRVVRTSYNIHKILRGASHAPTLRCRSKVICILVFIF